MRRIVVKNWSFSCGRCTLCIDSAQRAIGAIGGRNFVHNAENWTLSFDADDQVSDVDVIDELKKNGISNPKIVA